VVIDGGVITGMWGSLAATAVAGAVRAGAKGLGTLVLGPPEQQALERVYTEAFAGMVRQAVPNEAPAMQQHVAGLLDQFLKDDKACWMLVDVAIGQQNPPLALLRERFTALHYDTSTLPAKLDDLFVILVDELGQAVNREASKPGSPLQNRVSTERSALILDLVKAILGELRGERRGQPGRPYQLPADLADFTGREAETDALAKLLRAGDGHAAISSLKGMGGVGKTALAVHVGHRVEHAFPDGIVWVPMRGTGATDAGAGVAPLSPAEAMGQVIRAFAPTVRLPDSDPELAGLYRGVLQGKRVLLLLDNARDTAQVRDLTPDPPAALLVTSRQPITLPGIQAQELHELDDAKARDLLTEVAGEGRLDAAETAALVSLCGGLPLALRVAGMFLQANPNWTGAQYLDALQTKRKDLAAEDLDVNAVLQLSADALLRESPERAAQWRALTVFAGDFDTAAAAAVWERDAAEARDALSGLLVWSLLLYDADTQRYRMHDLMRPVATAVLDGHEEAGEKEAARFEAAARHAAHYKDVLAKAKELYKQGGQAVVEGLALADREWANIGAGWAWSAGHAGEHDTAARLCDDYPDAGVYVLGLRLHPREQIAWLEQALAAVRSLGDRAAEGVHLGNLGLAYADLGDARRAIEYHEQALAIDREIGDRRGEGQDLGNLGNAYADLGDPRRAIEYYEQHRAIAREIGDRRGEGNALGNLGLAYADLGEPRRAIEYYEQALAIDREIGDRRGEGQDLGNLGVAYKNLGEPRRAIELYEERLEIARELGDRRGEGAVLGNLGNAYADLGDPRRAIELYEQALAIDREIGDRRGEGDDLFNMALALDALGQREQARARAEAALALYEAVESPHVQKVKRKLQEWKKEA